MKRASYVGYKALAWVIFVAAVLQFFLAGLGVFGAADYGPHAVVGLLLVPISLLFLIVIAFSESAPAIAALHPVNGLLILVVSFTLAHGRRLSQITESSAAKGGAVTTGRVR